MYNKHGHKNCYKLYKALRRFSSLEVWKHFQKSRSLEVWKSGGLKRQLSWNFTCADFINPLSCQAAQLPNFRKRCAFAFTMADRLSRLYTLRSKLAFTMAEILISLTIIGVIAAITLPSLRANINESAWATQRKALYSRLSQAISMMPSLNGYGEYAGNWAGNYSVDITNDTAAARFITDGLSKVLEINNICTITLGATSEDARKELRKCGIPEKVTTMNNSKWSFPTNLLGLNVYFNYSYNPQRNINTNAAAFETKNGESVAVFYNPYCYKSADNILPWMCANFIYDLNGKKGPNKYGKDVGFITALYPTDSVILAPVPVMTGDLYYTKRFNSTLCSKDIDKNSRLPNIEELGALYYNRRLFSSLTTGIVASGTIPQNGKYTAVLWGSGRIMTYDTSYFYLRCIKK